MSTVEFERFLTCARHALLETASSLQTPNPSDVAALQFYAALARQCFVNEYVFDCDDSEKLAAAACRTKLLALLDADATVPPLLLLAVAAYFPLYTLRNASRLLDINCPDPIDAVLRQQIREPLEEQALRTGIECLTPITGGVSQEVRGQYEQNPYPRWVSLPIREKALRFNAELRRSLPFASFAPMPDDNAPEVLIAGCGTGKHSIFTAQRFRGIRVLAIDLSLSSISYAKRKRRSWVSRTLSMHRRTFSSSVISRALSTSSNQLGCCIICRPLRRMANPAVAIAARRIHALGLLQRTRAQKRSQRA